MADVKALLLNGQEDETRHGGIERESEVEVAVTVAHDRNKTFSDRFILLKQFRALVRRTQSLIRTPILLNRDISLIWTLVQSPHSVYQRFDSSVTSYWDKCLPTGHPHRFHIVCGTNAGHPEYHPEKTRDACPRYSRYPLSNGHQSFTHLQ